MANNIEKDGNNDDTTTVLSRPRMDNINTVISGSGTTQTMQEVALD
ncbi:unnamed protein product [Onchocerca flexuosa]|uniref:Capsid protein n=1 Tax=Onchocerca flexuosa TaxID=387005 RepID=A0A183HPT6_9BILA|nr:unnamed protein product [Onchocerca flexuosa]